MDANTIVPPGVNESSVRWRKRSPYGLIWGIDDPSAGRLVIKAPVPWHFAKLDRAERTAEARAISQTTIAFWSTLRSHGVSVPNRYECAVVEDGFPLHFVSDEGTDCAECIQVDPALLPDCLRWMVRSMEGVLVDSRAEVGLDARLSNFTPPADRSSKGKAVYVDLFPPLLRVDGHYHVHYPNPPGNIVGAEVARKFTAAGILRRFRYEVLALDPDFELHVMAALREALGGELGRRLAQLLEDLPDRQVLGLQGAARRRFVDRIPIEEVEFRREVAARLLPQRGPERARILQEVFVATSLAITRGPEEQAARAARYREILDPYL